MNAITRWDPFRELDELQNRLSTLFGRAPIRKNGAKDEALAVAEWAPVVDIVEDDNEYLIKAELPEVKKEDVKVTVQDDVLTISGERMFEKEEKDRKYHRMERAYGSFVRSFTLPRMPMGRRWLRSSRTACSRSICRSRRRRGPRASRSKSAEQ